MAHHHHDHAHGPVGHGRAFAIGVALNLGFVVVEAAAGWFADSVALLADAGHNLSDVLGLLLAWGAAALAQVHPTSRRTYGLRRSSILASLANAVILLIAVGAILVEAVGRFGSPAPVAGGTVIRVALLGIIINAVTAFLFAEGRKGDLNIRGVFLHMAADAGVSAGVVVAAGVIILTGWQWVDPVVGIAIAGVIMLSTWGLLRDSVDLALDAVPRDVDRRAVEAFLDARPGVTEVHDLHIWAMSTTETALTAHLVRPGAALDDAFLAETCRELRHHHGVDHATLQIETGGTVEPCRQAPADVV